MSKPTPLEVAINAIKSAPRCNRGVHWAAKPSVMGLVAVAILGAKDQSWASNEITKATGVKSWTLRHFIRGNDASGNKCQAIHDAVSAAGLMLSANTRGHRREIAPTAKHVEPTIPPVKAILRDTTTVAPVADATPVKPTGLAVTSNGEVITAAPPTAATTPTAMVAQGGSFATKTETTRSVIDPNTGDILIITTRRVLYGSPEHRAKMIEMNAKKS